MSASDLPPLEPLPAAEEEFDRLAEELLLADEPGEDELCRRVILAGRAGLACALRWLEHPQPRVRAAACYVLGNVGWNDPAQPGEGLYTRRRYAEAVPPLVAALENDPDEEVRAWAAGQLGHHASPLALLALLRAAESPSVDVRFNAVCSLGSYVFDREFGPDPALLPREEAVRETLLRLLDDEDDDVRDWATFGLHQGGHDTPETRARLWRALRDPHPEVRGEAAAGLAKFGDRSFLPELERLLREDEWLSPCYFEAAETFGDPALLPALEAAAERWGEDGEPPHPYLTSALAALRAVAEGRASPDERTSPDASDSGG